VQSELANKALVGRMHAELLEARDGSRVDEFFAPEFVSHSMPAPLSPDRDGARRFMEGIADALPDLEVEIDLILAEGDLVAVRSIIRGTHQHELMGVPASGRRVAIDGIDILRFADGRIVEHWGLTNMLGFFAQAGS
jgi:steroid delta-isomerase-like uncharacterized protein